MTLRPAAMSWQIRLASKVLLPVPVGPNVTNSGPIVSVIYSSNRSKLGAGDREITLNLADRDSQAGKVNASFLGGGRPVLAGKRVVESKANPNQIVFQVGQVVGTITATVAFSNSQWRVFLDALRAV